MKMKNTNMTGNDNGFTMVEVLITSMLMVIVLSAAWLMFNTVTNNSNTLSVQTTLSSDTDGVLDIVAREIRQAQELGVGTGIFKKADANDIAFYSSINGSSGGVMLVHYYRDGDMLYRAVGTVQNGYVEGPAIAVVKSLTGTTPLFRFYGSTTPAVEIADPTAHLNQISMVAIDFTATALTPGAQVTRHTGATIKIRCMFDSLN